MKNGVPQDSVLSPMLFNICTATPILEGMEEGFDKDTTILVEYLLNWGIQLNVGKTVSAAYHLNNTEAKRELNAFVDNKHLMF